MPYLTHPDLPHARPVEVPNEDAAAVLRESGWVDWTPPEPTPGIVPGTEDPPAPKSRKKPPQAEGVDD